MESKIDDFLNHLEFLGYTINPIENENVDFLALCQHPIKENIILVHVIKLNIIMFRIHNVDFRDIIENNKTHALECVNEINLLKIITYCCIDENNNLLIESRFEDRYDKIKFGVFIDFFLEDVKSIYVKMMDFFETRSSDNDEFSNIESENQGDDFYSKEDDFNDYEVLDETGCDSCPSACGHSPEDCEDCRHNRNRGCPF